MSPVKMMLARKRLALVTKPRRFAPVTEPSDDPIDWPELRIVFADYVQAVHRFDETRKRLNQRINAMFVSSCLPVDFLPDAEKTFDRYFRWVEEWVNREPSSDPC